MWPQEVLVVLRQERRNKARNIDRLIWCSASRNFSESVYNSAVMQAKILIVDDDPDIMNGLKKRLHWLATKC